MMVLMQRRVWSWTGFVAVVGLLWAMVATTQPDVRADEPVITPNTSFVGKLDGAPDSARIGIVCDGKSFIAYVCSGEDDFTAKASRWFKGDCDGKSIQAKMQNNTLSATVSATKMTGTMTVNDKSYAFTTLAVGDNPVAGLYRAEDTDATEPVVFGWVVDHDGYVAGARQQKGTPPTPLKDQRFLNGLKGTGKDGQPIKGQPVEDPKTPPKGVKESKDNKFNADRRKDFVNRTLAKTPKEGNALFAGMMQIIKRFNSGAKAETKVETAAYAKLKKMPKQLLVDFEKNFNDQPKEVRDRILGTSAKLVDGKTPVTTEFVKTLGKNIGLKFVNRATAPQPQAGTVPQIEQIKIKDLKCIKNTTGFISGEIRDEIFAIYAGLAGETAFSTATGILSKVKSGSEKSFAAADQVVFPPADNPTLKSAVDIVLTASLFEADPNVKNIATAAKILVIGLGSIVTILLIEIPPAAGAIAASVAILNISIDQIAANIEGVQSLGDASAIVGLDEKFREVNGNSVLNELKFKRTDNAGPAPFDFRLKDFDVKVK